MPFNGTPLEASGIHCGLRLFVTNNATHAVLPSFDPIRLPWRRLFLALLNIRRNLLAWRYLLMQNFHFPILP